MIKTATQGLLKTIRKCRNNDMKLLTQYSSTYTNHSQLEYVLKKRVIYNRKKKKTT